MVKIRWFLLFLVSVALLNLVACKKEPLLNCKGVDIHSPADPNHIDFKKLRCANNELNISFKPYPFQAPKSKSPYTNQLCPDDLSTLDEASAFKCSTAEFWDAFGDGRLDKRKKALSVLTQLSKQLKNSEDHISLASLYRHIANLELSMAMENQQVKYVLLANQTINKYLQKAADLDPTSVQSHFFKQTIEVILNTITNKWGNTIDEANKSLTEIDKVYDGATPEMATGAIMSVMATYVSLPLATQLPQKTMEKFEQIGCYPNLPFCDANPQDTPFARPGLNFLYAESYARIGNEQQAINYLKKSQDSPGFSQWPFKHYVLSALAHQNDFLNKFAIDEPYKQETFNMINTGNTSCIMCHGRP